jgi:hypothetical protein
MHPQLLGEPCAHKLIAQAHASGSQPDGRSAHTYDSLKATQHVPLLRVPAGHIPPSGGGVHAPPPAVVCTHTRPAAQVIVPHAPPAASAGAASLPPSVVPDELLQPASDVSANRAMRPARTKCFIMTAFLLCARLSHGRWVRG